MMAQRSMSSKKTLSLQPATLFVDAFPPVTSSRLIYAAADKATCDGVRVGFAEPDICRNMCRKGCHQNKCTVAAVSQMRRESRLRNTPSHTADGTGVPDRRLSNRCPWKSPAVSDHVGVSLWFEKQQQHQRQLQQMKEQLHHRSAFARPFDQHGGQRRTCLVCLAATATAATTVARPCPRRRIAQGVA